MDYLKDFVIPFVGLKLGKHRFHYRIDKKFFEAIRYAELKEGMLDVVLELDKQERMIIMDFHIHGKLGVICDRCLEPFLKEVDIQKELIFKLGSAYSEESDDIIIIPETDHQIDVSHYIYEFIMLSIPLSVLHPDDEKGNSTCNKTMLEHLNKLQGSAQHDPRWDELKKLKNKL